MSNLDSLINSPVFSRLSPTIRNILTNKYQQQEREQFIKQYKPQESFGKKFGSDIGTFFGSLPKIPGALWDMTKRGMTSAGYPYDPNKPFWKQGEGYNVFTNPESRKQYAETTKKNLLNIIPGYPLFETLTHLPYMEKIPALNKLPKTAASQMLNDLLLNSMVKNTGSWIYDPDVKGRKWFPNPKQEGTRWQEYKEHPFLNPLEDIVNVSIVAAPILKSLGVGSKLASSKAGQWAKGTKAAKAVEASKTWLQRKSQFSDITAEMQFKQFQRQNWLKEGNLKKALDVVPLEEQATLQALLEGKAIPFNVSKEVANAYKIAEKSAAVETQSLISQGLLSKGRHESAVWGGLTKEFDMSIKELKALGIKEPVYYPHTFEQYASKTYLGLQKKTPSYLKTRKGAIGYEEPYISIPKHKAEYITQKTIREGLNNVEKTFAKPIGKEGLLPGYTEFKPGGYLEYFRDPHTGFTGVKKATAYKNLQIPKQIDTACREAFRNPLPVTMEKFFKATWDKGTNTWKMSVLALSPRWIFNNIMGNFILNTAGGVGPGSYWKAGKAMLKAKKAAKTTGITFERAMSRQHVPAGAWQGGIYSAEARVATPTATGSYLIGNKAPVTSMWKKAGYKLAEVPKAMYRFNSAVEGFFRTAHYLDKVGQPGFSSKMALASVNEFLFDYSRMSTLEKATIRRIDPFWAWHKNITRLAATYPFKHPVKFALYQKIQSLEKDERDYRFIPEYLQGYAELPGGEGAEKNYLSTRGMNPFSDIFAGISALHPLLKIPIERATGTELWKGKPFSTPYQTYGQTEKVTPPLWRHIISQFPHAKLIETLFRPYAIYSTGQPVLDKEGQIKYQKSRLLEILKMFGINITPYDLEEMYEQGVSGAMSKQTAKENYLEKLNKYRNE